MELEYTVIDSFIVDGLLNQRVQFEVPLDHAHKNKDSAVITVCATVTQKHKPQIHQNHATQVVFPSEPNVMAYLQGGPGFPCAVPVAKSGYTKVLIDKGYQLVFYDQRGTGLSTPVEVGTLLEKAAPKGQKTPPNTDDLLKYILHFRADSIVEDMEHVRRALLGPTRKWSLLGQSHGGFCSFTYLSRYANSLKEVYVTGGVPPINHTADDVYRQTYERTKERNAHYYRKYPQDVARVQKIVQYLADHRVELPNGGVLSVERFQQLGIRFGAFGGTDGLHTIVTEFWHALQTLGRPTYTILHAVQNDTDFDTNVIYALFQEAIYCDGANNRGARQSNWAADRLRYAAGNENFVVTPQSLASATPEPIYFTGEMVYKSMYDDYAELAPLKELAYALHAFEDWSELYNVNVLRSIKWENVPIMAATYYSDQYVDFDLTRKVKNEVFKSSGNDNLRQYITSEFFHNGLRADPATVLGALFRLRDCDVD